ncbi:hypothetical protein [uncultured Sulfitobacter sp.]|uniref:hypothetical protein n=1 Tax=uncultured Sulfitobacter sp. TaxID=191468 RepID=UPI0026181606|nr:hypothetical protein [uncultured Sulfitobacter sp.]
MSLIFTAALINLLFQICDAFGAVGLSCGAISERDTFGCLVTILNMSVGQLALGICLATQTEPQASHFEDKVFCTSKHEQTWTKGKFKAHSVSCAFGRE